MPTLPAYMICCLAIDPIDHLQCLVSFTNPSPNEISRKKKIINIMTSHVMDQEFYIVDTFKVNLTVYMCFNNNDVFK